MKIKDIIKKEVNLDEERARKVIESYDREIEGLDRAIKNFQEKRANFIKEKSEALEMSLAEFIEAHPKH